MNGRMIGVNSAIFSKSGGSVGIGFAIPVNMVKIVIAVLVLALAIFLPMWNLIKVFKG